jgi:hypothetical protein
MYVHGQRPRQIPISNGLTAQSQRPPFHFQLRGDTPVLNPGTNDRVPAMLGHITFALMPPVVAGEQVSADDEEGGGAARRRGRGRQEQCLLLLLYQPSVLSYSQPGLSCCTKTVPKAEDMDILLPGLQIATPRSCIWPLPNHNFAWWEDHSVSTLYPCP